MSRAQTHTSDPEVSRPCPVRNCPNRRVGRQVLCRSHWHALPQDIRDGVYHAVGRQAAVVANRIAIRAAKEYPATRNRGGGRRCRKP
jgi:hypothetical protein